MVLCSVQDVIWTGVWYNKNTRYKIHIIQYTVHNIKRRIKHTNSFVVLEVGQGVVEEGLISFGS